MPGRRKPKRKRSEPNSFRAAAMLYPIIDYMKDTAAISNKPNLLSVVKINENRKENAIAHHTDEFSDKPGDEKDKKFFVIRRGQEFILDVTFNRAFDVKKDDLKFVFEFGNDPNPIKGTDVQMILSDDDEKGEWGAKIVSKNGNSLQISVITPPDCLVGKWTMSVDVVDKDEEKTYRYGDKYNFVHILFNPWCKEDTVYMVDEDDGEKKLNEYVLNEMGTLYIDGCYEGAISPKYWYFGQFEDVVLECVMFLLGDLRDSVRGDPIHVTRKISALVNANQDGGILVGNWSGDYENGKTPYSWTGSVEIIDQYMKTKESVGYGQCWVFSGVTTTLCRALGIPTRSVTNYESAHDTDASLTIDECYNEQCDRIERDDSIWNFHVWNEVFFARRDLPPGYDGWQAIDSTPQEKSDGVYCMGPYPLAACRNGDVNIPYDGKFLYAEVNSDIVKWMVHKDGSYKFMERIKDKTGIFLVTKAVNEDYEDFVTLGYKHPSGSAENRQAVMKASPAQTKKKKTEKEIQADVQHGIEVDKKTFIGETVKIVLKIVNGSNEGRTVLPGKLTVHSVYYSGQTCQFIERFDTPKMELGPNKEGTHTMNLEFKTYYPKLTDLCILKVSYMAKVAEAKQMITGSRKLTLSKPKLTVKAPSKAKKMQKYHVEVSFKNPLDIPLTNCCLTVDGPAIGRFESKQSDLKPNGVYSYGYDQTPLKKGKKEMLFKFDSNELFGVETVHTIDVEI